MLSTILSSAISYVAEPYNAAKECRSVINDHFISTEAQNEIHKTIIIGVMGNNNVSTKIEQLIKPFLQEIVGKDRALSVNLFKKKTRLGSFAIANGSFRWKFPAIYFSERFLQKISKGLEPKHKFYIAHELGHLVNEDIPTKFRLSYSAPPFIRMVSYAISVVALVILFPMGLVGVHLIGCGISKAVNFCFHKWIERASQRMEINADLFAARISPEIAQGGLEANRDTLQRKENRRNRKLHAIRADLAISPLMKTLQELRLKTTYTEQGENRFDFSHPSFLVRNAIIEPFTIIGTK